jgi:hypothetical protein
VCVFIERVNFEQRFHRLGYNPPAGTAGEASAKNRPDSREIAATPSSPFLKNVSRQSLNLFLIANVLTGLVNLTVNTTRVGTCGALTILVLYAIVLRLVVVKLPAVTQLFRGLRSRSVHGGRKPDGVSWGSVY